ncbi:MAG: carboxypeptidase M32, partial [Anaerolineae bacterium]
ALIDLFEPEMQSETITPLFANLKIALTHLLKKIGTKPVISREFIYQHFSLAQQLRFGHDLLKTMGFNEEYSRLDQSAHPFCSGIHPTDTRMTTHIHPNYLLMNIFAVIHEAGHGLYNKGIPEQHFGSPLGEHVSLGIEESQSRFWEAIIGHSMPFWQYFFPKLQNYFPEELQSVYLEDFYRAINCIKPSLIRIEADEITYSLHIIVRFEIEKALIDGSLKVKEIPEVWNAKMREYLGIVPQTDSEGCLQDIHWSLGLLGYFPTYTLGNLYASQFFKSFETKHPHWKEKVSKGDLHFIVEWLHENIHRHGKEFSPNELVLRITGGPLTQDDFISYLEKKYQTIYHF